MNPTIKLLTQCGFAFVACNSYAQKPNIIYILADDLGYNEISVNGQRKYSTPNIDKLASEGISFTQHYSGSPVSAPSRCVLLTGLHTGHAYVRDNQEIGEWDDFTGQLPLPDSTFTIAEMLKEKGYKTACVGKWGLGFQNTSGSPLNQGFDYFFGYFCQRQAHNYYPEYLWRNNEKVQLNNPKISFKEKFTGDPYDSLSYKKYKGNDYSPKLMADEALKYIRDNKKNSFFLYMTFTLPHLALQAPDNEIIKFKDKYDDKPYLGNKGYLPSRYPRATYAAMISLLDQYVGMIMEELKKQGIDDNTIVMFSSDNGATFDVGGAETKYFESNNPFRGFKTEMYEGGIRVPLIVRWNGKIKQGIKSDLVCGFQDIMPTLAEITKSKTPKNIDGISILPTLTGKGKQTKHPYLYWEYHSYGGSQAARMDDWKAIRRNITGNQDAKIELYNLKTDITESTDLSLKYPEIVEKMKTIFKDRTQSSIGEWNFVK